MNHIVETTGTAVNGVTMATTHGCAARSALRVGIIARLAAAHAT